MDVPFNMSGASSASHYSLVRHVENAKSKEEVEELLVGAIERARQRARARTLSPSELKKDLIILLYSLNASSQSITTELLQFALPSALHLTEAGSKTHEKFIGYLFCSEVMPPDHELALMLVNTIRKDLESASPGRLEIALSMLISNPSTDVVPAVRDRVLNLLSHSSPKVKVLAMNAYVSLSRLAPDMLWDGAFVKAVTARLNDGEESVIHSALKISFRLATDGILTKETIIDRCLKLMHHIFGTRNQNAFRSNSFRLSIITIMRDLVRPGQSEAALDLAIAIIEEFCVVTLSIIRRAVLENEHAILFEAFRLLGQLPVSVVMKCINTSVLRRLDLQDPNEEAIRARVNKYHPVPQIRHFLSSRQINEHYLFLSCICAIDQSIWSDFTLSFAEGTMSSTTPFAVAVLDKWEVERIISFLESEDERIRELTMKVLHSQEGLTKLCYTRAVDALRRLSLRDSRDSERARAIRSSVELAFNLSLSRENSFDEKAATLVGLIKEISEVLSSGEDHADASFVQHVLQHAQKERPEVIHTFLSTLSQDLFSTSGSPGIVCADTTLLLIFLALLCEHIPYLSSMLNTDLAKGGCTNFMRQSLLGLSKLAENVTLSAQETVLLAMTRLAIALRQKLEMVDFSDTMEEVINSVETVRLRASKGLPNKSFAKVLKRCEQFLDADVHSQLFAVLEGCENYSLPEFALLLDRRGIGSLPVPSGSTTPFQLQQYPSSKRQKSHTITPHTEASDDDSRSPPSSRRILRYTAYDSPSIPPARLGHGSAKARKPNKSSPRTSDLSLDTDGPRMVDKVSPGELTMMANATRLSSDPEKQTSTRHHKIEANLKKTDRQTDSILIPVDSPFLSGPLADLPSAPSTKSAEHARPLVETSSKGLSSSQPSPYVSANTSLRATPEPDNGQIFEMLWETLSPDLGGLSVRGWHEGSLEDAVRQLQKLPAVQAQMDVISGEQKPFLGEFKVLLRTQDALSEIDREGLMYTLIRLHEEEDGTCLWQARGKDQAHVTSVKKVLI